MAVGSTAPISNRAARAAAVAFYQRLLAGHSVERAFGACNEMLKVLSSSAASASIYTSAKIDLRFEIMHRVPMLVADFKNGKPSPGSDGHYSFRRRQ
jgi:hypothetical protein